MGGAHSLDFFGGPAVPVHTETITLLYTYIKKTHPYNAICTASDNNILGVPLVSLCEADTQDVWLRPAGSVNAGQQLALHVPQVELRSRTGRNLTLR